MILYSDRDNHYAHRVSSNSFAEKDITSRNSGI